MVSRNHSRREGEFQQTVGSPAALKDSPASPTKLALAPIVTTAQIHSPFVITGDTWRTPSGPIQEPIPR